MNHYGKEDVAMFDFTSMHAAENASRIIERKGKRILMGVVGDTLIEVCERIFSHSKKAAFSS